jgi:hypothetical protein
MGFTSCHTFLALKSLCVSLPAFYLRIRYISVVKGRLKAISLPDQQGEVVVSKDNNRVAIHRAARAGTLRKLAPRVYTTNSEDAPEKIALANCWTISPSLSARSHLGLRGPGTGAPVGRIHFPLTNSCVDRTARYHVPPKGGRPSAD